MQLVQDVSHDEILQLSTVVTLEPAPDGIQLIHHNVLQQLSKFTGIAQWLHACQKSPTFYAVQKPGLGMMHLYWQWMGLMSSVLMHRPDNSKCFTRLLHVCVLF